MQSELKHSNTPYNFNMNGLNDGSFKYCLSDGGLAGVVKSLTESHLDLLIICILKLRAFFPSLVKFMFTRGQHLPCTVQKIENEKNGDP